MHVSRPHTHRALSRLAVVGVATLASAIAVAPTAALADDLAPEAPTGETPTDETTPASPEADPAAPDADPADATDPSSDTSADESETEAPSLQLPLGLTVPDSSADTPETAPSAAAVAAADEMKPVFGNGKNRNYRVDASIDPGAFVPGGATPEGTMTAAGSTFTIVTTLQDGTTTTATCTTIATTLTPAQIENSGLRGYSSCPGPSGAPFPLNGFTAPANATMVTITQDTAPENLLVDPDPFVLLPCVAADDGCVDTRNTGFVDAGSILPVTVDDAITVTEGDDPVEVDVLANDTSDDPATALSVTAPPAGQGTVRVIDKSAADGAPAARAVGAGVMVLEYTPPADFTGIVPITYTVTNSNGSTDGTLTVTVEAGAVVAPPTEPVVDDVDAAVGDAGVGAAANLPNAGGPGAELLGLGALLVAAGGGVTLAARRRRDTGVHAG